MAAPFNKQVQKKNVHDKECNACGKSIPEVSAENHLYSNQTLLKGASKSKEVMNCCSDFWKLQSLCLMLEWEK